MTQTPISVTTKFTSSTPATIYTVPALKTAVVKTVEVASVVDTSATVTLNKVIGGVQYPIVEGQPSALLATAGSTYWAPDPGMQSINLLAGPITLGAGEALSISSISTSYYKQQISLSNTDYKITNLKYVGTKFVAVGYVASTGYGLILTSPDGITWTKQTFNYTIQLTDIAYDGSTNYVVVGTGSSGYVYYSTNLTSWTQQAVSGLLDLYCLTYGNGKFVAGGITGEVAHCTNPNSWTRIAGASVGQTSAINTILTIGTKWCFGTVAKYFYSSDMTNFVFLYYTVGAPPGYAVAINSAGTVFASMSSKDIQTYPSTAVYKSTDNAKTFTAIDLSGVSNRPTASNYSVMTFNNGGTVVWPHNYPGTNCYYVRSGDGGATWSSQAFTGTSYGTASTVHSKNAYTNHSVTYNYILNWHVNNGNIQMLTVGATGAVTDTPALNFVRSDTYLNFPSYGYMCGAGNPHDGSWIICATSQGTPTNGAHQYGTGPTNGSDSQFTDNTYSISTYSYPSVCLGIPGSNGYFMGTAGGYIFSNTSKTATWSALYSGARLTADNGALYVMCSDGDTATSRTVVMSTSGYMAYSSDQGVTWTRNPQILTSPSYNGGMSGCGMQFSNGKWIYADSVGKFYYSTDGITWITAPGAIVASETLNSLNVFVKDSGGLVYTSGTSVDTFTTPYTTTISVNPSTHCMQYVNSKYLIGAGTTLYESSDLVTWTTKTVATKQINDLTYIGSTANIAYSGTGNNILFGNGIRAGASLTLGTPDVQSNMLNIGYATVGLLEVA